MRVLVLGATSLVAQAVARVLVERGVELALAGRDAAKLAALRDDLLARGAARAEVLVADLEDVAALGALVHEAERRLGPLDGALVAMGWLGEPERYGEDAAALARVLHVNLVAPAAAIAALGGRMAARGQGCVVAITSVAGERVRPSNFGYGAAKGGLSLVLEGLRSRLAARGVRVVDVRLGRVDTPMTAHLPGGAFLVPPAAVAGRIAGALEGGPDVVYAPAIWRLVMLALRLVPGPLYRRLVR